MCGVHRQSVEGIAGIGFGENRLQRFPSTDAKTQAGKAARFAGRNDLIGFYTADDLPQQ